LKNLFGGFGILLLTGAALCFIAYFIHYHRNNDHSRQGLWLGIALVIVDVFSAFFTFYQVNKILMLYIYIHKNKFKKYFIQKNKGRKM
jgi:sodium/potassium-transporting ATPase subunit alpha